jgi:hypothetical protein
VTPRAEDDVAAAAEGPAIINASWAGTGAYAAVAVAGTIVPDWFAVPTAALSGGLFVIGCVVFLWAYGVAVSRSRTDAIGIGGLYFLAGSAPRVPRFRLRLSFAIEIVVAIVSSSIRPFTPMAFGFLVPVYGLGMMGLWGARHGVFGPRTTTADESPDESKGDSGGDSEGGDRDDEASEP